MVDISGVPFYLLVIMTALAAFFVLIPMALATARGSEANAPLGRAVIGGILAGLARACKTIIVTH